MLLMLVRILLAGVIYFVSFPFFLLLFIFRYRHPDNAYWYNKTVSVPLMRLFGLNWEVKPHPQVDFSKAQVFVANHQSNFDGIILAAAFPKSCRVVGKRSIAFIPIFGWLFFLSGQVLINRSNKNKALSTLGELERSILEDGVSAWLFPEGTRSKGKGLNRFKKGAFFAAVHCQVPIQPMVISPYLDSIDLKKWRSAHIVFEYLNPIPTKDLQEKDVPHLTDTARSQVLAHLEKFDV